MNFYNLRNACFGVLLMTAGSLAAQAPENWHHTDLQKDNTFGISDDRAYEELLKGRKSTPVIVAVIDSGTDTAHEDLKPVLWVNKKEIPGNGIDDDKNGYIDDIHGWNFIGGKDGRNVSDDNLEMARLYKILGDKFKDVDTTKIDKKDEKDYALYKRVKTDLDAQKKEYRQEKEAIENLMRSLEKIEAAAGGQDKVTVASIESFVPENKWDSIAQTYSKKIVAMGAGLGVIRQSLAESQIYFDGMLATKLNPNFNPRDIVGDNYEDASERYYGNNDVMGPESSHGTHVAGIIGAARNNELGMNGIADNVQIMIVRCVPDGDERDKDVANSIRYAVDNGAKVINMSFGKSYSFNKKTVDDAVKYAASKDVLLIHGAGNDAKDNDISENYPNPYYEDGKQAKNWIEVGASTMNNDSTLPADFSNYGKNRVDIFAPGHEIYSTIPGSNYERFSGTSMASPVVAGVAALIRSYFPKLDAVQVKEILMKSVTPVNYAVVVPGSEEGTQSFSVLCKSGGVVNVYQAVELAMKKSK